MRKLTVAAVAMAALTIPALALAERFNSKVSIHSTVAQDRIHGVVQAPVHKCENSRRIVLRYRSSPKEAFAPVDEDLTDGLGQYEFDTSKPKRGLSLPDGQYFVRALRKKAGNDICRRADSRVIELRGEN